MNKYSEMNDDNLVQLTLLGEDRAYEELVIRHEKIVLGSAYKVTSNTYSAEDAAQDAFVCAWMHLNSLRRPERFCSWVCTIAKNHARDLVAHYRECAPDISLDLSLLADPDSGKDSGIDSLLARLDGNEQIRDDALHDAIETLSEGVRRVILLHYFEDMSVAQIAEKLQIPEGTVKWRLSEGRKKLRKEYGVMEKTPNESLVRRVMYQVEKLKLWELRTDKSGFEEEYRAVLALAEKLDDGEEKSRAMADILIRGYWWIDGEENDELLERIKLSAEAGHNDDVMQAWAQIKLRHAWESNTEIQCITDELIPYFTQKNLQKSLGFVQYRLGNAYGKKHMINEAKDAFKSAIATLCEKNMHYHAAKKALDTLRKYGDKITDPNANFSSFNICTTVRRIDDILYNWQMCCGGFDSGTYKLHDFPFVQFIPFTSLNSIILNPKLRTGDVEKAVNSGGQTVSLRLKESAVTVSTPAGTFKNCVVYESVYGNDIFQASVTHITYCHGVGIVSLRCENSFHQNEELVLSSYDVHGDGLFPIECGNRWAYEVSEPGNNGILFNCEHVLEVVYADNDMAYLVNSMAFQKIGYTDTWIGNITSARLDYCIWNENGKLITDMSDRYSRAIELAETPRQLTHAKVAANVAKRIYDTDFERKNDSVEDRSFNGLRNIFEVYRLHRETGDIRSNSDWNYHFDAVCPEISGRNGHFILNNSFFEIIGYLDGKATLWSDKWVSGYHFEGERPIWIGEKVVRWKVDVSDAPTIETAAGKFEECLCVAIWSNAGSELGYMAGNKEYYYAPGVGIVKYVTHYSEDGEPDEALPYELTSYRGTGEGFFPMEDGMFRRYEAVGIGQGCTASVELSYSVEGENDIVVFCDQTGVQQRDWRAPEEEKDE